MSPVLPSPGLRRSFQESLICFTLALRTSLHPSIILRSCFLCLLVFGLVTWLFVAKFSTIAILAGLIALYIVTGGAFFGIISGSAAGGASGMVAGLSIFAMAPVYAWVAMYTAALGAGLIVAAYFILIVLGIHLTLHFSLTDSLSTLAGKHYPPFEQHAPASNGQHSLPISRSSWWGSPIAIILYLCIPVVNSIILLSLLAYLNVRTLVPITLRERVDKQEQRQIIMHQRKAMIFFSLLLLPVACIPVLNLLLPALLGAGTAHLAYRGMQFIRTAAGSQCECQVSLLPP